MNDTLLYFWRSLYIQGLAFIQILDGKGSIMIFSSLRMYRQVGPFVIRNEGRIRMRMSRVNTGSKHVFVIFLHKLGLHIFLLTCIICRSFNLVTISTAIIKGNHNGYWFLNDSKRFLKALLLFNNKIDFPNDQVLNRSFVLRFTLSTNSIASFFNFALSISNSVLPFLVLPVKLGLLLDLASFDERTSYLSF